MQLSLLTNSAHHSPDRAPPTVLRESVEASLDTSIGLTRIMDTAAAGDTLTSSADGQHVAQEGKYKRSDTPRNNEEARIAKTNTNTNT